MVVPRSPLLAFSIMPPHIELYYFSSSQRMGSHDQLYNLTFHWPGIIRKQVNPCRLLLPISLFVCKYCPANFSLILAAHAIFRVKGYTIGL